jgi:hypothetical protein
MKWLKLFLKIEKYIPRSLRDKIMAYFFKKKLKGMFFLSGANKTNKQETLLLDKLTNDPEFLRAVKKLQEAQDKVNGTSKR